MIKILWVLILIILFSTVEIDQARPKKGDSEGKNAK